MLHGAGHRTSNSLDPRPREDGKRERLRQTCVFCLGLLCIALLAAVTSFWGMHEAMNDVHRRWVCFDLGLELDPHPLLIPAG
jgi:hypothetical protein